MNGTYWNGAPRMDLTLDKIAEAAAALDALPKVPHEFTVAPDVLATLLRNDEARSLMSGIGAPRIYQDVRLPAGAWHPGKPLDDEADMGLWLLAWCRREEQLREPLPALDVFRAR